MLSGFNGREQAVAESMARKKAGGPPFSRDELARRASDFADPRAALARAQVAADSEFDTVLVAEWLQAPPVVALLGDSWCVRSTPPLPPRWALQCFPLFFSLIRRLLLLHFLLLLSLLSLSPIDPVSYCPIPRRSYWVSTRCLASCWLGASTTRVEPSCRGR